jgi:hypothetical protein
MWRGLAGRIKSRSHQTISEQVFGSGAMTKTGSAKIRHSHIDHSDGRIVDNARRGDAGGRDARILQMSRAKWAIVHRLTDRGMLKGAEGLS